MLIIKCVKIIVKTNYLVSNENSFYLLVLFFFAFCLSTFGEVFWATDNVNFHRRFFFVLWRFHSFGKLAWFSNTFDFFIISRYLFNTWLTKRASNNWNSSFVFVWIIFIKAFDWILPINFDAAFKWCRPQKTAMGKIKTSSKRP